MNTIVENYGTCTSCSESFIYLHDDTCYPCLGITFAEPDPPADNIDDMLVVEPPKSATLEVVCSMSDGSKVIHYFSDNRNATDFYYLREQVEGVEHVVINQVRRSS